MKLARPNIFHPRIVLAACPQLVDGDGDDDGLVGALRARGLHARWLSWDDPQTESADLVILRATWDYTERRDEFLAWTRRVRNLLNAPAVVAWNSDKHYLHDLAAAGVPVVPSVFFEPGDTVSAADFGGEVVVKPAIGAGSIDTQRFVDVDAAAAHAVTLLDSGRSALVQPYDERVAAGETALVFLGGEESAAAGHPAAAARLGDLRRGVVEPGRPGCRIVGARLRRPGRRGRASGHRAQRIALCPSRFHRRRR
jgi:hypothetical protein